MTEPDFTVYPLDTRPIRARLGALNEQQAAIMRRFFTANEIPTLDALEWPQLQAVGKALTAVESDTAIGGTGPAGIEIKTALAEQLTRRDDTVVALVEEAARCYGIDDFRRPEITQGEAETLQYILKHQPATWSAVEEFPGAELRTDDKGFEKRRAEAVAEAVAEDDKANADAALERSQEEPKAHPDAPDDWHQVVPKGSVEAIKEWVKEPLGWEAPDRELAWERAHRALVAEDRVRAKPRKGMRQMVDSVLPLGYKPPYLRTDIEKLPPVDIDPTQPVIFGFGPDDTVHFAISNGEVRAWVQ